MYSREIIVCIDGTLEALPQGLDVNYFPSKVLKMNFRQFNSRIACTVTLIENTDICWTRLNFRCNTMFSHRFARVFSFPETSYPLSNFLLNSSVIFNFISVDSSNSTLISSKSHFAKISSYSFDKYFCLPFSIYKIVVNFK